MTLRSDFTNPLDEKLQGCIIFVRRGQRCKLSERAGIARIEAVPQIIQRAAQSFVSYQGELSKKLDHACK